MRTGCALVMIVANILIYDVEFLQVEVFWVVMPCSVLVNGVTT
jgi:hypothetical protein